MLRQAAAAGSAEAMLEAGAGALQQGAFAEAVAPVEGALRAHPGNARLWHLLGLLHRSLEDLAPSVDAFGKAAELAPDDPMIAHARACVNYEAGLPAADLFQHARRFRPGDRAMLLQHSAAQIAEGESEAAVEALEHELVRDPLWLQGHAALSRLRWTYCDHETFVASFERALLAAPREVGLWRAYVEALFSAQFYEESLAIIERARMAAGSHHSFDAAEAIARSELGQMEAADALFRRVAHLRDVSLIVNHLRFLLRAGRYKEAVQIGEAYVSQDPTNQILPYLSLGWRLTGDPRWEWLEGDPRFIGVYDIADRLPPLDALAECLRTIHRSIRQPLNQSLRGGTQTEDQLFPRIEPEIHKLRQAVVEAVELHADQLPAPIQGHPLLVPKRRPISFTGSWSVRLTGGGRHVDHFHPAGWLSSALYIALPDEAGRGGDEAGWLVLGEATELGVDLPPIRTVEPKPGRLVLFPSTMWHGTRPFQAGERLTVAFDVKRPS